MTDNEIVQFGLREVPKLKLKMLHAVLKTYNEDLTVFIKNNRSLIEKALSDVKEVKPSEAADALVRLGDARIRELISAEVERRSGG